MHADALLVATDPFFFTRAAQLVVLTARHAIPTLYFRREFVAIGGLISYGSNAEDTYRALGLYAGRIPPVRATDMIIKSPLPGSETLLRKVQEALGPDRLPLLIAIDGADGIGKSSLASWLAWQLGAPAIYLDLYVIRGSNPLRWRSDELQSIIHTRLVEQASPLVVEGVLILDALGAIGRKPDFLVCVDGEGGHGLSSRIAEYRMRHKPEQQAQFRLNGFAD
jgi:hypothetical protein